MLPVNMTVTFITFFRLTHRQLWRHHATFGLSDTLVVLRMAVLW